MKTLSQLARRFKKTLLSIGVLAVGAVLFGAIRMAQPASKIPLGSVERKEFVDYLEIRGEVRALRSKTVVAPFGAGDLQIIKLAANGAKVKKGDVLVEFDATSTRQKLATDQSALKSADAGIQQSKAAARLKEEQDLTDVMKAKYDAESARMDASKQEILSAIDGEEARLKLADAVQKEKEAEAKLKADRDSAAADIASKQQKREQAAQDVQRDEYSLQSLELRSSLDGVVALMNNWRSSMGMGPALFKTGDRAWPGAAIAELPDPSTLRIAARIEEAERGQLKLGQIATVRISAVPDRSFEGTVDKISATASLDFNGGWPIPRNFEVELSLKDKDDRLSPGMSAEVRVAVDKVADGIVMPASGVFRKAGRTVAYIRRSSKFEETPIEVTRRSGDDVLIAKGLVPGQQVALKDPTAAE
ncbi:MAG TPA: efflux RND transporter periplasmic adaptor subunit [Candidatus Methylomirabilis sp.]|nr:efflux RND transporter periplasmic adaptor subunit [Candidatus Methylomirabilis sp.]